MTAQSGVLDVHQAGAFLGAHVETVRRMARRHEIPAFKVGKDWRFRETALQHWVETHHIREREPVILVVDDEARVRRLIQAILEPDGCRVVTAANGAEALASAERDAPDVLILDLKMDGMTGVEVLRQLRQKQADLPVIILTGYSGSQMVAEALSYPPVTLLPKSVENEIVRKTVRLMLDGARRR
jgi:two-component system response regulator (stage 0 sporulation protein F)